MDEQEKILQNKLKEDTEEHQKVSDAWSSKLSFLDTQIEQMKSSEDHNYDKKKLNEFLQVLIGVKEEFEGKEIITLA